MATPESITHHCKTYHIERFWDDEFKHLDYEQEPFNDQQSVAQWLALGFGDKMCGWMCDMRRQQPSWNAKFVEYFQHKGWNDIGTSYYRMTPGTVLPQHGDTYRAYIKRFDLHEHRANIRRAIVFLEDWQQGHYLDCMSRAFVHWQAGDVVEWSYDTPHSAANLGFSDRYTLQITGHIKD